MTASPSLFRPYAKLVKIQILGKDFEVPENNTLLRCLQFLQPEPVAYGRFCWNKDCQYCRVSLDTDEGSQQRAALACKLMAQDGMRVKEISSEIKYCLRGLEL